MPRLFCLPPPQPSRRAGFYPARAVKYHKFDRADANPHAPVGADDPVRPAGRIREYGRANANTHTVCRGRCPHRPARGTSHFYEPKQQTRDCPTGGQGRPPLQDVMRGRRWRVQFCDCLPPGRARHRPLRASSRFTITSYLISPLPYVTTKSPLLRKIFRRGWKYAFPSDIIFSGD